MSQFKKYNKNSMFSYNIPCSVTILLYSLFCDHISYSLFCDPAMLKAVNFLTISLLNMLLLFKKYIRIACFLIIFLVL